MEQSIKKELILNNLDCANCASKIENEINKIPEIKKATVNFMNKKLIIEVNDEYKVDTIINEVVNIINKIEPDVKVVDKNQNIKEKSKEDDGIDEENSKKEIIKLMIAGIIYILGLTLNLSNIVEFCVFIVSYLIVGSEVLIKACKNILKGQVFDENFLMAIATIGAFLVGQYPEGVAVMLFYQVGELFQDIAVNKSRKSITSLMDIRPDFANLKLGDDIKTVSPEEVNIDDVIVIKPGEKVPLDGTIIEGKSMVDTSALTGESVPRNVGIDDEVLSGFINKNGVLTIRVNKEFGESTVSKILDLVQNASSKKAETENFITKFARYYTPIVVITSLLIAIIPPIIISGEVFSKWIYRALIFLVISCPCALVISIPLGFFGGIGAASKKGILVKGSNYLEALNDVEIVVFDKTGTLTQGVFSVTEINPQNNYTKEDLLEITAYGESFSNHPIALSILKTYGKEIDKTKIENYSEISGHGISVNVDKKEVFIGNTKLMNKENIDIINPKSVGTIIHVAIDKVYAGYIVISDKVKDDSQLAIKELKSIGIKQTAMLTGDSKLVGESVGKEIGLDEVYAELLPTDKVEKLELIDSKKSSKGKLAFVGDGINDAPVLARADIGIAMGGLGSDAAIEAADIVLMTDEPSKLVTSIKIAKRTKKIVWQNIIFALSIKMLFLILGAFGIASMWEAVFADVGVSVIAILNSMRVINVKGL